MRGNFYLTRSIVFLLILHFIIQLCIFCFITIIIPEFANKYLNGDDGIFTQINLYMFSGLLIILSFIFTLFLIDLTIKNDEKKTLTNN